MDIYAVPKNLQPTNGSGVVLNIAWYKENPADNVDLQPSFHDQVLLIAADVDAVTDQMIQDAIEKQRPAAEIELGVVPVKQARASVRAMLGKPVTVATKGGPR